MSSEGKAEVEGVGIRMARRVWIGSGLALLAAVGIFLWVRPAADEGRAAQELLSARATADGGDVPGAIRQLEATAARFAHSSDVWYTLGLLYSAENNTARAGEALRRALEIDPKSARAHRELSQILHHSGDLPASLDEARAAQRLDPWDPQAARLVALCLLELPHDAARLDEAEGALRRVGLDESTDPEVPYLAGRIDEERGRGAEAIRHYERARSLDAAHDGATYRLALLLRRGGRAQEADRLLQAFERERSLRREVKELRGRLRNDPERIEWSLRLAADLRSLGDVEGAESVLRDVLRRHPENLEAQRAVASLEKPEGAR